MNTQDTIRMMQAVSDAAINAKEEQYGTGRMTEVLNKNKDADMEALLRAVKEDIDSHAGKVDQFDDITMIGFRYDGPAD